MTTDPAHSSPRTPRSDRIANALRRADYMNWSAAEVAEKIDGTVDALEREARRLVLAELRAEVERLAEEHGTAITQGGNFVVGEQLIEAIDVLALVDRHLREGEATDG